MNMQSLRQTNYNLIRENMIEKEHIKVFLLSMIEKFNTKKLNYLKLKKKRFFKEHI